MVSSLALSSVTVEDFVFSPSVCPPASDSSFFLGGAGVRGLMIEGMFVTFSGIGVYLEEGVVESLATKWQGKSANILAESVEFFRDIVTVPFAKFIRVTLLKPLTGSEFSRKVVGNCRAIFEEFGMNTEEEIKATEKFLEIFKKQSFIPGSSILFKQSPNKSLQIAFTKHGEIPEAYDAVIENGPLSQAVLESMIGRNGVSPATKGSLAARLYELMNAPKATNAEVKPKLDGGEIKE